MLRDFCLFTKHNYYKFYLCVVFQITVLSHSVYDTKFDYVLRNYVLKQQTQFIKCDKATLVFCE
jgi:hypothetical protein